ALIGLGGFVAGVCAAMFFVQKGFTLGKQEAVRKPDGFVFPILGVLLLVALLFFPAVLNFSEQGFASFRAPVALSLIGGMAVGGLAFISRFCSVAPVRDSIFMKSFGALSVVGGFMVVLIGYNIIFGHFELGMEATSFSHTNWLWNFLSLGLVGFTAVLAGGCPLRQLVHVGTGNTDAAVTVLGMMTGTALVHNFGLASSSAGPSDAAWAAFIIATAAVLVIAVSYTFKKKGA
ncbi:MAG: YedE family putative selenium transporter, partial [Defluviitaleaceae bacterium]|nr:YedE family putative selenium transporter [Defluviitaleaceae bacterium]